MKTKNCIICNKVIVKKDESLKVWATRKYCSQICRKGTKRSVEDKKRISDTCKRKGIGKWMNGRVRPIELRIRQSKKMKEIVASGKHNFWKGGIAEHTRKWRSNFQGTLEYKLWRTAVFTRDNYQ